MTPAARVQGAIDLLDAILAATKRGGASADRVASEWFKARRYAGSGDRRAIRELAWRAIRASGEPPPSGRAAMLLVAKADEQLATLFDGSNHAPGPMVEGEDMAKAGIAPAWLIGALKASGIPGAEFAALLDRAPLDLRANRLKTTREALLEALPAPGEPIAAAEGLRFPAGTPAETWPQFAEGLFEVQDGGSQLACAALRVQPGEAVVDLCAGAGGKTLALAAALDNRGTLLACDTDRARLQRLPPRAARAGAMVETRLLDPGKEAELLSDWSERADAVLVDAPCSGTGTWRRNPETRWRLQPADIKRHAALQNRLLDIAAALVRPGGRIGYAVCSLLDAEGADQAAAFLARHPGWRAADVNAGAGRPRGTGVRLTPFHDGTDGFFFTVLQRL
ncbi:RsmB/NOP family class I SAM-dependent RNA methyltransferase [Novosphingobium sp. Gsoil 351]|uniref:RsmB/NOP family class I SAM-dependent RNA methyltransferase n=1 Tax=Novosphingobium sp. Gsoil 351 TaxID=2675225 RepID=UPI0012B5004A|nr:RsmB/NOP family class I SAM-dependent RNA methyltransferase [Novosphingobium sp. Gsoil 351]QGN53796.1 RsmB/NOP family class I SAM-dependent RNA methyltransferase [Novosphingobium sp. Gsoil 351]